MIDSLPKFQAHLSRHGHNLQHKFDFTSSTGHLLTLFSQVMNPHEKISGKIDIFSRTQPLNTPAHVDIDTHIDYFFVPFDMLYSGFGDSLYQVNEPYSSMISVRQDNALPVANISNVLADESSYFSFPDSNSVYLDFNVLDNYDFDSQFMSLYRNLFHNYINPNCVFNDDQVDPNIFVTPIDRFQPNVLPLTLMSYNAVYQNFYRLDDRELFENQLYNIDLNIYNGDSILDNFDSYLIRYRPLNFDYFTAAKVSPFLNGLNLNSDPSLNSGLTKVNNYLSSIGVSLVTSSGSESTTISNSTGVGSMIPNSLGTTPLSVNNIRSLFAVEKIMSVTGRAKKTYDAQVLAHLGVKVPRDIKHEITYVGSQHGSIHIGEIIATAGTSDTPLGDMAGKGYGQMNNNKISFTAPCHGMFIAIYSAVPRLSYYAPLEKHAQITSRLDFWHPEFEKLGMQPIYGYELMPYKPVRNEVNNFNTHVFGWQMRYEQYKRRFDKVSPAFSKTLIFGFDTKIGDYPMSGNFNSWSNWVLAIRPLRTVTNSLDHAIPRFLSSPFDLNDIMAVSYGWMNSDVDDYQSAPDFWRIQKRADIAAGNDLTSFAGNVASLFYRDPLLHFANIDFKLVSSMGENTLPDLNL